MLSNLYGDFVKGKNYSHYPKIVQKGIYLHRSLDYFIDSHPIVTELRLSLYDKLPKVAGIAIDLYFDHLLARNWRDYHKKDYSTFLTEFYLHRADFEQELKVEFSEFMRNFRARKWLDCYPTAFGLAKTCEGVSKRISFENLLHSAPKQFYVREKEIKDCFEIYMKDAILKFKVH